MIDLAEVFDYSIPWQMSLTERIALLYILSKTPCKTAIEIGAFFGGSLRSLAKRFEKVYSLDIEHLLIARKDRSENVEFITGDSAETLPALIDRINESDEVVNFVLIDGCHEFEAVSRDLANVLKLKPKEDVTIILHDSWHPSVRDAISGADWKACPYVEYIEKDFVAGELQNGSETWGGFAIVCLSPDWQGFRPQVKQSQDNMYLAIRRAIEVDNLVGKLAGHYKG